MSEGCARREASAQASVAPHCRSYSQGALVERLGALRWISDGSVADDRSEIRPNAHTRALSATSERSTPDDPSEIRRNAQPRAQSRTSERSDPGRAHVCMIMSTPSVSDLLGFSGSSPTGAGAGRGRGGCPGGMSRGSHRPRRCAGGRVGFTAVSRGWVGGRPRRGGTPVPDETVTAGCPRNCPVVLIVHSWPTTG
jgi:hypothetical protein